MPDRSEDNNSLSDPARRHVVALMAAGAARLSAIAASSALLTNCRVVDADRKQKRDPTAQQATNCYAKGTNILTANGERPVEDLKIGDPVLTTNGPTPIKWIGRQILTKNDSVSWHPSIVPVCISRYALNNEYPRRDLYLSPQHALFIDDVLIPVEYLVNGRSVTFTDPRRWDTIEYFLIELETHEVIFAEGAPAETFLFTLQQVEWEAFRGYSELYGSGRTPMKPFAPICRYKGGRAELRGLMRLAASRFVDVRDPIQIAYDRIATRATSSLAA